MIGTLGLAKRARKLITGTDSVIKGLQKDQVKLVVLSSLASDNTKKTVIDKTSYYQVEVILIDDYDLNRAIGKTGIKVVGITDDGFKKVLLTKKGM